MKHLVPTRPIVPTFTPVPRKYRYDGWTPATHDAAKVGTGFAPGVMGTRTLAAKVGTGFAPGVMGTRTLAAKVGTGFAPGVIGTNTQAREASR